MVSAGWLARYLTQKEYKVIKWDELPREKSRKAPDTSGVYALYQGSDLKYIGKASSLYSRTSEHRDSTDIPFDSFAYFKLPKDQIDGAEAELIYEYDPPCNSNYPTHPDDYED